jgi:RNA polymerase sigma-70 factor (ECF subfamily)
MLNVAGYPVEDAIELLPKEWAQTAENLCARLSRLDVGAWESLYVQHRRLVRGVLAGQLGYSTDLEDITQQVFETAMSLVETGRVHLQGEPSGVRAWLVAITLRLARSERRRRGKLKVAEPTLPGEQSTAAVDPAGWQLLLRTQALVAQLPARLRDLWLLRHLEGMQLEEIAQSCGVSLATVKRRLARAERKFELLAERDPVLREHLKERGAP